MAANVYNRTLRNRWYVCNEVDIRVLVSYEVWCHTLPAFHRCFIVNSLIYKLQVTTRLI